MPEIVNSNQYGPVTEKQLADFEQLLGFALPADYREFLLMHNGGEPSPYHFSFGDGDLSLIADMYGLHDGPEYSRLDKVRQIYAGRIPDDLLAIGDDPGGNEVCIGLRGKSRGVVYFWDHETGHVQQIATSFRSFLDELFEWVDPDEHAFTRICRTHDLAEVQRFIDSGIDLDTTDENGGTLLELATKFGHMDIVKLLHDAGASLRNARKYAEDRENEQMIKLLDALENRGRK